jgi:hypothetical protein
MNRKHTYIAVVAALSMLVAPAAAAGKPAGTADPGQVARGRALNRLYGGGATTMSADEFRAIYLRGVALDKLYHLGDFAPQATTTQASDTSARAYRARGERLNAEYGNGATRMSPDEFRAMYLRSDALNKLYRLGDYAPPSSTAGPVSTGNGFDWTTAGIATGAVLVALLAISLAAARARRWHPPAAHSG